MMNMKQLKAKTIVFTANNTENMNAMLRAFDKAYRIYWNGYGGKRIASWTENGLLKVKMLYEAYEHVNHPILGRWNLQNMVTKANYMLLGNKIFSDEIVEMYWEEV